MNYTHLTREERYQIYALKKAGHKQNEIAQVLERSEPSNWPDSEVPEDDYEGVDSNWKMFWDGGHWFGNTLLALRRFAAMF